ncbi:prostaglandin E receptor 4 (subtype EP4) c [Lates japonicus]|uniref:Prostaglandin E receptor 4 (Subtype EP4) c n=1 Tax=Lates japonicus TaxID=270547 RepID=A0AAD3MTD6_LATJO|nr:prostaglandin E receptor 4 (subtype EP4) c [Lates japonicus]
MCLYLTGANLRQPALYDPAHISAGGKPDYRSDLLAIRFASFNPAIRPWVYICAENLLLKGVGERLKRVARVKGGRRQHRLGRRSTPPSLHSNDTSYVTHGQLQERRGAPVESTGDPRVEEEVAADSKQRRRPSRPQDALQQHRRSLRMSEEDIVTCTFSTELLAGSAKCL